MTSPGPLHTLAHGTDGPRVAFLHGLFGQGRNWMQVAKGVSGPAGHDARCLLVDLPDHGRSPWSSAFSFTAYADAVVRRLTTVAPGERWTLVGHSLGGKTAMVAALAHPDVVERLAVVDIAPRDYGNLHRFEGYVDAMRSLPLERIHSRAEAERLFAAIEPDPGVRGFLLQNLRRDGEHWRWQANLDLVARQIAAGGRATMGGWEVSGATYDGPVLWLAGADSDYVTADDGPAMRALFPKVRLVTVKHAGHWVHTDAPDVVIGVLRRFVAAAAD